MSLPATPPCSHQRLHFDRGAFYLVCSDCNTSWMNVGADKNPMTPNFAAMNSPLSSLDTRVDPFGTIKLRPPTSKPSPAR